MSAYILYNPKSGNGSGFEEAQILEVFQLDDCVITDVTKITDYPNFLSKITADDTVILCGGDGTLNRFVNDTDGYCIPCDVLYYPIGTGNDFAHDLGYHSGANPFSIKQYIQDLPSVTVNNKKCRFLNGIGYGIDGYCCEEGDRQKAAGKKKINYTEIAIKGLLSKYKPKNATVCVDGKKYSYKNVWIAATMKGRYYGGGMMTAPAQDRLNPKGEVTLVVMHGSGKFKTLRVFPSIFKGEHIKHAEMCAVHTGRHISVTFDEPASLQIDGETVLNVTKYSVEA